MAVTKTKCIDFNLKNEFRNAKWGRLIKWSIKKKIFFGDYEKTRNLY